MRRSALLLVLVAAGCGDDGAPRCTDGFHVCGGALRDGDSRAVILRGVNLAGAHKQAPYVDAFGPADYTRLRADWGFTGVRFLFTWAAIEPDRGQFDEAYLDWIAERIGWASDAGLAVVLDMHQDVYGEGFGFDGAPRWTCDAANYDGFVPRDPWSINYADPHVMACFDHLWTDDATQADFAAAWRHVAERFAAAPAVLGFDLINEPSWGSYAVGTFERDRLQPFYERTIAAVRAAAPQWIAFAEPANSRNLGFATSLGLFAAPDVVYAPHLYDTQAETTGHFDPTHAGDLIANVADLRDEATAMGAGLWIGEYGGFASDPQLAAYLGAAYDGAAAVAAGTMYWSYDLGGGGYSPLDDQGQEIAAVVDAIVRPYPARIAGEPVSWTYDPSTRALEVQWHPDRAATAPTVIIAPTRLYPDGVTVDCAGCTVELAGDEIRLGPPPADPAIARLTPR